MKYRKRPVEVDAYMFAGGAEEPGWPADWIDTPHRFSDDGEIVYVLGPNGRNIGYKGDFVIKDADGKFSTCEADVFEKDYAICPIGNIK